LESAKLKYNPGIQHRWYGVRWMSAGESTPLAVTEITGRCLPFLKWAGGKGDLLAQYRPLFPRKAHTYFEPFMGSAAVFFYLKGIGFARRYRLFDVNEELVNTFTVVRDDLESLIELLEMHRQRHSAEYYLQIRSMDRDGLEHAAPAERAARSIYLNRTCYNGLWRVNGKGHFNVPMGRYNRPAILDVPRLRCASAALVGTDIAIQDFRQVVQDAREGDFVYFDPPYMPLSSTSNFTSYAATSFGEAEQRGLAEVYKQLSAKKCKVMLSNSDTAFTRDLYTGFRVETVQAKRRINSNKAGRGSISELVVLNYDE
jgi:DNA adenine methylase